MCSIKQVRLATLFVMVTVLLAGAQALAQDSRTFPLQNMGVQPSASGYATLSNVTLLPTPGWGWYDYGGQLSVTCTGLAPRKSYLIGFPYWGLPWLGVFKTDHDGVLTISNIPVTWQYSNNDPERQTLYLPVYGQNVRPKGLVLLGSTSGYFDQF